MSEYKMRVTPDEFDALQHEALIFVMQGGYSGWIDCVRKVLGDERTDAALAAGGAELVVDWGAESPTSRAQMPQDGPEAKE